MVNVLNLQGRPAESDYFSAVLALNVLDRSEVWVDVG